MPDETRRLVVVPVEVEVKKILKDLDYGFR
jgi:hypothetical protein